MFDRLKPVTPPECYDDKDEIPEKIDNENTKIVQPEIRNKYIKAGVLKHKVSHDMESRGNTRTKSGRAVTFKRDSKYLYE